MLQYVLLRRASEIWAYDGLVYWEFCLKRGDLTYSCSLHQITGTGKQRADRIEVCFIASKVDSKLVGAAVSRARVNINPSREVGEVSDILGGSSGRWSASRTFRMYLLSQFDN